MRTHIAYTVLLTLAVAACSPDVTGNPISAAEASLARSADASVNANANANQKTKHIKGTVEAVEVGTPVPGNPILLRRLEGTGTATHLGRFTIVGELRLNLATASGTGTGIYTAANGDMLMVSVTGQAVIAAGIATVTETATVTGGTGRFEGATGTLTVIRRVVQATGVSTGTIDGTITMAK
ncbi:MAG: hypothetical protein V4617_21185 [Gemmatimonadota bacterium]